MKATITRDRTMFGKLTNSFTARLDGTGWSASGETKEAAAENLRTQLEKQNEHCHCRRYLVWHGTTFALHYANGWAYDIIKPDGSFSTCMMGDSCNTYMQALDAMTRHFKQWQDCQPKAA